LPHPLKIVQVKKYMQRKPIVMTKEGPIESLDSKIDEFVMLNQASNVEDLFDVWKCYVS
jgi:hypothetical protein